MNTDIDMKVRGNGNVPAGEYNEITVRGKGRLFGTVRASLFSSSGTVSGENIECIETFKSAGKSSFSGYVKSKILRVSGTISCQSISAEELSASGSLKCNENTKADNLSVAGSFKVGGDIEAENAKVRGHIICQGLVNAESLNIKFSSGLIGSIGGGKISVSREKTANPFSFHKNLSVSCAIEGDEISLERVECPRVTGKNVVIGKGCKIDLLEYSESVKISKKAKISRVEKI